jgi:type II secretory pathway predicted ATPase ExeA
MLTALPPANKPRAKQLTTLVTGQSFDGKRVVVQELVELGHKLGKVAIS